MRLTPVRGRSSRCSRCSRSSARRSRCSGPVLTRWRPAARPGISAASRSSPAGWPRRPGWPGSAAWSGWLTACSPRNSPRSASPDHQIVPAGATPEFLARQPVSVLGNPELTVLLPKLGIRTLGEFAALPAGRGGEQVRRRGRHGAPAGPRARSAPACPAAATARPVRAAGVRPALRAGGAGGVHRQGTGRATARQAAHPRAGLRPAAGARMQRGRPGNQPAVAARRAAVRAGRRRAGALAARRLAARSRANAGRRARRAARRRDQRRRDHAVAAHPRPARPRDRPPARPLGRCRHQRPARPRGDQGAGHARPRGSDLPGAGRRAQPGRPGAARPVRRCRRASTPGGRPWPGRIPAPTPASVYPVPRPAVVTDRPATRCR